MNESSLLPALPESWSYPDAETAGHLHAELQRELPPGHLLHGVPVRTFAWREEATDDTLFQHVDDPHRFTVIHLTWRRDTEVDAEHPTVEFDGTFEDFVAQEERIYGLAPQAGA